MFVTGSRRSFELKKPQKNPKTEMRISPAAHVINSSRAQGDRKIWNISMRSPQVRVLAKFAQQGHAGWNAAVISRVFKQPVCSCRMGWKVVCWVFWGGWVFFFSYSVNPDR